MTEQLTPELKAAFEAIIKAEIEDTSALTPFALNFAISLMLKAHNYRQPLPATLTLQFEQIINNMPQEGEFTLPWICELMGKARDMDRWVDVKTPPAHKDLVLVDCGIEVCLPAIYYSNNSFKGFWKFTSKYHVYETTVYSKVSLKQTHEILNVMRWQPLPNPPIQAVRKDGEG